MQVTSQLKDPSFAVALENSGVLRSWWLWAKAVQLTHLFFKWAELKLLKGPQAANTLGVLALVGILRTYNVLVLFWILSRKVGVNLIHFFYKTIVRLCVSRGHCHIPSFFFFFLFTICCKHSRTVAMALFLFSLSMFVSRERYVKHL